jgi:hydroxyacid-oxoacid transhydrogenase
MAERPTLETGFTMDTSSIKFGPGITRELGFEMARLGASRVMLVTDVRVAQLPPVAVALESLRRAGIDAVVYDGVRVEPTDGSFKDAIRFASEGRFDSFVAVGGGSSIDTAKAANLYTTHPADLLEYVNAPIGNGTPVPGPLKPLIAVPTTAGTGSETTGVAIFDLEEMRAKTGIAHRSLRPAMGIVDPDNTETLTALVAACSGFDVLCHGLESYTALPYSERAAAADPAYRPAYQGANPISDVWAERAIEMTGANIRRAVLDPADGEARSQMLLAASFAGVGFGNAGVHLCHGMSYPVSGNVRGFVPSGYPQEWPIIPHGMSVILNAPAVFRFTASASPQRHLSAARLMGADVRGAGLEDAGEILSGAIIDLLRDLNIPNGLAALGYSTDDVPALVEGTLPQRRVLDISPRPVDQDSLATLFRDSMTLWE